MNSRIARWALELENYNYETQHRSGLNMPHADALSRNPEIIGAIEDNEIELRLYAAQNRDPFLADLKTRLEKENADPFELRDGVIYRNNSK